MPQRREDLRGVKGKERKKRQKRERQTERDNIWRDWGRDREQGMKRELEKGGMHRER